MKFTKIIKATKNKKYVIFENLVSENIKGYWNEYNELVNDVNDAKVITDIEIAKKAIENDINILKENDETLEHYYEIRPVILEDLSAVYQIKYSEVK